MKRLSGRPVDKPRFPLLRTEGGMSPINIPIKPPPRVNTANGVNRGGGSDCDRERKREEGEEKSGCCRRKREYYGEKEREKEMTRERDRVRNPIRSSAGLL